MGVSRVTVALLGVLLPMASARCDKSDCNPPSTTLGSPLTAREATARVRNRAEPHIAMASSARIMDAWDAIQAVTTLRGDIVECGVYKGGTSMVMAWSEIAHANVRGRKPKRRMWLYDTFEGLPPPTERDDARAKQKWAGIVSNSRTINQTRAFLHGQGFVDASGAVRWNYGPLELVQANMRRTGYPSDLVRYVKGKTEETLLVESNLPKRIAVLRLDTDFYEGTRAQLQVLLPRLVPGGVLIVDDYCTWGGSRAAVDEVLRGSRHGLVQMNTSGRHCFRAIKKNE